MLNYSERAKEFWEDLKEHFLQGNGHQKCELKAALANYKQEGDTVAIYYSRLRKSWDELEHYQILPNCDGSGNCSNAKVIMKERDEDYVYQFLMWLNDVVFGIV